jgi:hypothetical protein
MCRALPITPPKPLSKGQTEPLRPTMEAVPTQADEARTIAAEKLKTIEGLSWEELDADGIG